MPSGLNDEAAPRDGRSMLDETCRQGPGAARHCP